MKVTDIQTIPYAIPLKKPIRMSSHLMREIPVLLVKVMTDEGIEGFGETYCFKAIDAIIHNQIKPLVVGEDPFDTERMVAYCLNRFPLIERPEISTSAVAGVEMACWDIVGKFLHLPVYKLLGGCYRKQIPITCFLGIGSPDEVRRDAVSAVQQGFRTIKLKVGRNPEEDIEIVKAVRGEVGGQIMLRIDANQAWSIPTAIRQIKKMARYDPQYVEQPIPRWDINGLAHIRKTVDVPIGVCEGAFTIYRVMELIRREALDFLSTDPVRMGGLLQAKKLSGIAEAAGIPVVTHISEGDIQTAAWLHWIASTPSMNYSHDISLVSNGIGWVRVDTIVTEPVNIEKGYVEISDKPGLGVEIDKGKLTHYTRHYKEKYRDSEMEAKLDKQIFPPYPLY